MFYVFIWDIQTHIKHLSLKMTYPETVLEMMFLTSKESNGPKIGPITAKNVPKAAAKIGFFL